MIKHTRHYQLDFIKILAIIGVVFIHTAEGYTFRADYFASSPIWLLIFWGRVIATVSVPFFIMTSGYLTIGKNYPPHTLAKRIIIRLLIPFIFFFIINNWLATYVAIHNHFTVLATPLPRLSDVLLSWFTSPGSYHFFAALIGLNLLLPLWERIFTPSQAKNNYSLARYLIPLFFLASISINLHLYFNPNVSSNVLNEWHWTLWISYFLYGYWCHLHPMPPSKIKVWAFWGLVQSFLCVFLTRLGANAHPNSHFFSQLASYALDPHAPWNIICSLTCWRLLVHARFRCLEYPWSQSLCATLASWTLGIYIFNNPVLNYLNNYPRLGTDNLEFWHRPALAALGLTGLVLVLSSLLTFIFGCIPALRVLVGLETPWVKTSNKNQDNS